MPEVRAQIILSVKNEASGGLSKTEQGFSNLNKGMSDAIQNATGFNVASLGLAGAVGALGLGLKFAVTEAAEAERIMAKTEAVVKATGMAAGLTANDIGKMAGGLSQLNAIDDETTMEAQT